MNYSSHITMVVLETRNWRHRDKALVWFKDYGLEPLTKHIFIGELYAKERRELERKFKALFTRKTEKFFFVIMCKTCFNENMSGAEIKTKHKMRGAASSFELLQMSEKGRK